MPINYQGSGGGVPRKTAHIFAKNAANNDVTVFGSTLAQNTQYTDDIADIQNNAFEIGWRDAVISNKNYPLLADMNGVQKTFSQQIAYILQHGLAQWDSATAYYTYDIVNVNGVLYICTIDNNVNSNPTSLTGWAVYYDPDSTFANIDLSNLSTDGNDRLHALKGYEDAGELLTDAEGLADVTKYAHSTFDLSKFSLTGTPTITNGVVSGFSGSDYIKISTLTQLVGSASSWELNIKFKTPIDLSSEVGTLINGDTYWCNLIRIGGDGTTARMQICLTSTGYSYDIASYVPIVTVEADTTYYLKLIFTGTEYICKYSTDGSNYTSVPVATSTSKIFDNATYLNIGVNHTSSVAFNGLIDLKEFSIIADDILVFSGNKTGIDTYTINGSTVSIPYILSKTGSKIVYSAYRTQVSAIYEKFGYAPYYTLKEGTNFTIPQGELYGMIGNISNKWVYADQTNALSTATNIGEYSLTTPLTSYLEDNCSYICVFRYIIERTSTGGNDNTNYSIIVNGSSTVLYDSIDSRGSTSGSDLKSHGGQFMAILDPKKDIKVVIDSKNLSMQEIYLVAYKKLSNIYNGGF